MKRKYVVRMASLFDLASSGIWPINLLCFHVELSGFEGQIHFSSWPQKLKKRCNVISLHYKRIVQTMENICLSSILLRRVFLLSICCLCYLNFERASDFPDEGRFRGHSLYFKGHCLIKKQNLPLVYIKFWTEVSNHQVIILAHSKLKNVQGAW